MGLFLNDIDTFQVKRKVGGTSRSGAVEYGSVENVTGVKYDETQSKRYSGSGNSDYLNYVIQLNSEVETGDIVDGVEVADTSICRDILGNFMFCTCKFKAGKV